MPGRKYLWVWVGGLTLMMAGTARGESRPSSSTSRPSSSSSSASPSRSTPSYTPPRTTTPSYTPPRATTPSTATPPRATTTTPTPSTRIPLPVVPAPSTTTPPRTTTTTPSTRTPLPVVPAPSTTPPPRTTTTTPTPSTRIPLPVVPAPSTTTPPRTTTTTPARITPPATTFRPPTTRPLHTTPANHNYLRTAQTGGGFVETRGRSQIHVDANGRRTSVVGPSGRIDYHADGSRTVSRSNGIQYTQRHTTVENRTIVQRTYVTNVQNVQRTVVRNYHVHDYGGYHYYGYAPTVVFDRYYYDWSYRPWSTRVYYRWSWYNDPWYTPYGYYFRPYPYYSHPCDWLTDYLISDMLLQNHRAAIAAAEARSEAAQREAAARANDAARTGEAMLTDQMKEQIRTQVEETLRAHERRESTPLSSLLRNSRWMYVISEELDVTRIDNDQVCSLSEGDIVQLAGPSTVQGAIAEMVVIAAKRGGCPVRSRVRISLTHLQEAHNEFVERVERGLAEMRNARPDGSTGPATSTPVTNPAPQTPVSARQGNAAPAFPAAHPVRIAQWINAGQVTVTFPSGTQYPIRRVWVTKAAGSTVVDVQYELVSWHRNSRNFRLNAQSEPVLAALVARMTRTNPQTLGADELRALFEQVFRPHSQGDGSWAIRSVTVR